jgi:hypothetical protein
MPALVAGIFISRNEKLKQIILSATQFARSFSKVERKNRLHGG